MLNNTRLCPNCRSPLPSNTCRKCGYQQKILKVVDQQQEFGRFHYANKIQGARTQLIQIKRLTREQKLMIYLKQYQRLIKRGVDRLIQVNQVDQTVSLQIRNQIKYIWQTFLIKKKQLCSPVDGIFKRYLPNKQQSGFITNSKEEDVKHDGNQKEQQSQEQIVPQVKQHETKKKRGRPAKGEHTQKREISLMTNLRCFINITINPLKNQSKDERQSQKDILTSAQRAFLSFLLGCKNSNIQFLIAASAKYLKLVLAIDGNKADKFVKQSLIVYELKKRNCQLQKTRQKSICVILLYDLFRCEAMRGQNLTKIASLSQMLESYEAHHTKNQAIDLILQFLNDEKIQQRSNIPQISYELIYSMLYLATMRSGMTLSVGQVIVGCGPLEIQKIQIDNELYLSAVLNEESITSQKIRRTAHLLTNFLNLSFPSVISKWSSKWCHKLEIMPYLPNIQFLNRLIFGKLRLKNMKKGGNGFQQSFGQKYQPYFRYIQLEQDLATLAGIMIFLKMANGINDYPYLIHFPFDLVSRNYNISQELSKIVQKLYKNKQITIKSTNQNVVTKKIPQIYSIPLNLISFCKKLGSLNQKDKFLGAKNFNFQMVKLRNLSHLNKITSMQLVSTFKNMKQAKQHDSSGNQLILRYTQSSHQSWVNENIKKRKIKSKRVQGNLMKESKDLSGNIVNQLRCIVSEKQKVLQQKGSIFVPCLLDQPSSNYQLMYEYGNDNLVLVNRCQQLLLIEQLCMNVCSYNEMIGWINNYQSVLREFETK